MPTVAKPSITHDRVELKYKLAAPRTAALARGVSDHLHEHHFRGEGSNRLPRARHYVTTIYFDTDRRDLYRAVRESDDNLKVRAREYYDLHPELLELATSARELVRYAPVLWVEVKGKEAGRTYKRRLGIPKPDVAAFFEEGVVSDAMRALQAATPAQGRDVIDELLALRERYGAPLRPSCLANYRRTAFENGEGTLRVTIDQRLAYFAPPHGLWTVGRPLTRDCLGSPASIEPACIIEVKATGSVPGWLVKLLDECEARREAFSKFVCATKAVYSPRDAVHA